MRRISGLFTTVIQPLYEAYFALDKARKKRGALELDVPEVKIKIGKDGLIQSVSKAEHYASHSLVEEFMINASGGGQSSGGAEPARDVPCPRKAA